MIIGIRYITNDAPLRNIIRERKRNLGNSQEAKVYEGEIIFHLKKKK